MGIKIVNVTENGIRSTRLSVDRQHPEAVCEPMCYNWEQIKGAGFVYPEFGLRTIQKIYRPPFRPACADNPVVILKYGEEVLDSISIPLFTPPKPTLLLYVYFSKNHQWVWQPALGPWPPTSGPAPPTVTKSNNIFLYLLAYGVNCMDEVSPPWAHQVFQLIYDYNPRERRWVWYYGVSGGLMGGYPHYLNFPWQPYYEHLPRIETRTYRDGSEKLCCPPSLDLWNAGFDIGYKFTQKL